MLKHGRQKLFIDCTSTIRTNIVSGVQRVVRQFLDGIPSIAQKLELEVIPICGQFGNYYTLDDATTMSLDTVKDYEPVQISYNDIYFCPDAFWSCEIYEWYEYFKSKGAIIITMVYDLIPLDEREFTSEQDRKVFRAAFEKIIQYSDSLLTPTHATKQQVIEYLDRKKMEGSSVPKVQVSKIAPIFWTDAIDVNLPRHNAKSDIPNDFLLMVGTIEKRRGYLETIESLAKYWEKGGGLKLKIVGKVADDNIVRKIKESGYPIEIMSSINDDALYDLYKSAQAVICSSLHEGYGLPVAEGLLFNGKVLANKLPVFGEFAGSMPYYFDMDNPNQLVDLVCNIEFLQPVESPYFIEWDECYDDLVRCIISLSPLHELYINVASRYLNRAIVYQTYLAIGLGEPNSDATDFWIENFKYTSDFLDEINSAASQRTTDLAVYYAYSLLNLGNPSKDQREFWKNHSSDFADFVEQLKENK